MSYSYNHVSFCLTENRIKPLDDKKVFGAVLMNLLKDFDSIPHDLLIFEIYAYGCSINIVTFFYSYLKRRNQNVRINNTHTAFKAHLSGDVKGSILRPLHFNLWIAKTDLLNFASENTISELKELLKTLFQHLKQEVKTLLNGS